MSDEPTYDEKLQDMVAHGAPRSDLTALMQQHNDDVLDLDALPRQQHHWVDRGLKMSCEGAGHPMHQAWKFRPRHM